jgi:hypothetical protein
LIPASISFFQGIILPLYNINAVGLRHAITPRVNSGKDECEKQEQLFRGAIPVGWWFVEEY